MTIPPTRVSQNNAAIGPKLSVAIIADLVQRKATHVNFHCNRIHTLEIPVRGRQMGRNKDAVAVVSRENCLDHVIDLDLSSNALNEGCELSQYSSPSRYSLLSMTPSLARVNISSNGLTEKSLCSLICIKKPGGSNTIPLLPCLRQLDISHNRILKLPNDLNEIFPALTQFSVQNNRLKSLTDLLQALHNFGGRLESINLWNKSSDRNNPVCHKRLYREKTIFILGNNLKQLDGIKIKSEERAHCRLTLSRNYEVDVSSECQHQHENVSHCYNRPHNHSRRHSYSQFDYTDDDQFMNESRDESASQSHLSVVNDGRDERMSHLELQVASLSAIVEKQANDVCNASKDHGDTKEVTDAMIQTEEGSQNNTSQHSAIKRHRLALAQAVLRIIFIKRSRKNTHLLLAFLHWKQRVESSSNMKEARRKWQKQTAKLVESAKNDAESRGKLSISIKAEKVAHDKAAELTSLVNQLKKDLETERERHRDDSTTIEGLRAAIMKQDETQSQLVNRLRAEMESSAAELRSVKDDLYGERSKLERLEASVASCMAEIDELNLEAVQKDAAIRQLKEAFENVASKAAEDKSLAERACLAERQAKDLFHKQVRRISEFEEAIDRLKSTNAQLATIVSNMRSEIDQLQSAANEKDDRIQGLDRRINTVVDEHDETQRQLKECRRTKTRLEERNNILQSQLDCLHDKVRSTKDDMVRKDLLDAERDKNTQLQYSLDKYLRELKEQESELQRMQREHGALFESSFRQEKSIKKLKKAQSDWRQKEAQLVDQHRLEMKETKTTFEQETLSLYNALDKERVLRKDAERRIIELEASQNEQKAKMQNAIEGLTKQLTSLT